MQRQVRTPLRRRKASPSQRGHTTRCPSGVVTQPARRRASTMHPPGPRTSRTVVPCPPSAPATCRLRQQSLTPDMLQ
jgi:hypothetical protein